MVIADMGSPLDDSRIFKLIINPTNQDIIAVGDAGMSDESYSGPEAMLSVAEYLSQDTMEPNGKMLLAGALDPNFNPDANNNGQPLTFPSTTTMARVTMQWCLSNGSIVVGGTAWTFATPSALRTAIVGGDDDSYPTHDN